MKKLAMLITLVVVLSISCVFATDIMTTTAAPETVEPLTTIAPAPEDATATIDSNSADEALPEDVLEAPNADVLEEVAEEPATLVENETATETSDTTTENTQSSNSTVIGAVIAIVIVIAVIAIVYVLQKK